MHILWIGTKSPSPPEDGGRLVTWLTLQELSRRGHRLTLVAPSSPHRRPGETAGAPRTARDEEAGQDELHVLCSPTLVPSPLPGPFHTAARSLLLRLPFTAARHRHPRVRRWVGERLQRRPDPIDVIHVEQLQALMLDPLEDGPPVVLRAQNVESDLWHSAARVAAGPRRLLFEIEARRIARYEATALARPDAVLALTHRDAHRLGELSQRDVVAAPPPFPDHLPPGRTVLPGDPPLVVLGASGWLPNRDGTTWLLRHLWPGMRRLLPDAVLHLFGWDGRRPSDERVAVHPPPEESADAFAPGAVLVVPLRIASGVRMKILEAWARGVPVIATPEAAAGLLVHSGDELLLADGPQELADAVRRVQDKALRTSLLRAGRAYLRRHHDPTERTDSLLRVYEEVRSQRSGRSGERAAAGPDSTRGLGAC